MKRGGVFVLMFLYVLVWAFLVTLLVNACSGSGAFGARQQVILYYGVYCETGKSTLGLQSVTCRPRFGNGYTMVMARQSLMLLHNGDVVWIKRNR